MLERLAQYRDKDDQGFTLIELLVVTILIGILAAIAITVFLGQRGKAYDADIKSDLRNAATAEEAYLSDNGGYATTIAELQTEGFKPSAAGEYWNQVMSMTLQTDGTNAWYCLSARSASGNEWTYDSGAGGLLAANQGCISGP
jgi:type IV pilus assembly protein PilA